MTVHFSQAREKWDEIFKVLKEKKNCHLGILYPAKPSCRYEGERKTLPDNKS